MNVKTIAIFIVTSMMSMTMLASTAMAAITVDGNCADWTSGLVKTDQEWPTDPDLNADLFGYDLKSLWQYYDSGSDILYFRIEVSDKPADLSGDGDINGPCLAPPSGVYDCTGVGPFEMYSLVLTSSGHPGATLTYQSNTCTHPKMNFAYSNCIEISLSDASDYVDPYDYCLFVSAGGSGDLHNEDTMQECIQIANEPPEFSFTWSQKCDLNVRFSGHGTDDGNIVNHTWDFGDGSAPVTSNGPPGTTYHTFPANGTYTVTLSGYDNDGLSGTTQQTFHVAFVPCQDVPVQTPPGIAALIGLLGLIGAGVIMRRR